MSEIDTDFARSQITEPIQHVKEEEKEWEEYPGDLIQTTDAVPAARFAGFSLFPPVGGAAEETVPEFIAAVLCMWFLVLVLVLLVVVARRLVRAHTVL